MTIYILVGSNKIYRIIGVIMSTLWDKSYNMYK